MSGVVGSAQGAAAMTTLPRRRRSHGILGDLKGPAWESWDEKHLLPWVLEAPYARLLLKSLPHASYQPNRNS